MKKNCAQFEVILGSYEEFVLGYQFLLDESSGKGELTQSFATHSHRSSVRAVASHGKLVVSGGADETINIYNMFTRRECGMLMEHNGTVTSLSFTPDGSHVISTSEDGSIKIFRQGSWQLEKVWSSAHKGNAVTCLSIHPSGKMALSVGKDHTLRTWNLVKGRPAYTTNLSRRCRQLELVVWSPEGTLFAIPMDSKLEVTDTNKAGVLHTLELSSKVTACLFLSEEVLCTGEASGAVAAYNILSATQLWTLPGHHRVRGLARLHGHLVTATSAGLVSVYAIPDVGSLPQLVTSTDCGCRITCITLYDYKSEIQVKNEPLYKKDAKNNNDKVGNIKKKRIITELEEMPREDENNQRSAKKNRVSASNFVATASPKMPNSCRKSGNDNNEDTDAAEVVCSPRTQKWIVESSKR